MMLPSDSQQRELHILLLVILGRCIIQPVPELPLHRKQACADNKRDSKITKINFPVAHIKFSISPIPEARPQILLKNRRGC
jgi:hypothetical protein